MVTDREGVRNIIYNYNKKLFGKVSDRQITLGEGVWDSGGKLSQEDNAELTQPFTEEEVRKIIFDMK